MLSVDRLRELATLARTPGPDGPTGVPAADVLPHLESDDRNVRVAALRVLAWSDDTDDAVAGFLRALDDPKRRVREVAVKSCVRFLSDGRLVARLLRTVEEDDAHVAAPAVEVLGGSVGTASHVGLASDGKPVAKAMAVLADHPRFRRAALSSLLRTQRLDDDTRALLQGFVRSGSKEEAVFATRRLDGFRIAHDAELTPEQRRTAERAHGRVWYWVRVGDA